MNVLRACLLLCTLSAFAGCRAPTGEEAPLKLGSYGPLSGSAASWGVMLKSMRAYIDFINAEGGIHGRKLELLIRDDQYNPAKTPLAVRDLVDNQGVFAIVGGLGTANGRSVVEYLGRKNIPFFTPASGDPFFTTPTRKHVYTVYPRYDTEGQIIGQYLAATLGKRRVAVLHQDDDFGLKGAEGLERGLESNGAQLVLRTTCLASDVDLSAQVSAVIDAKPDALVLFAAPRQAAMLAKKLHALGKKPPLFTSFVLSDPIMFELAGKDVWADTMTSSVRKLANSDDVSVVQFREVLAKYAPDLPVGSFTMSGFAFAQPFVEALHRAGPNPTPDSIYTALHTMKAWAGGGPYWRGSGLNPPLTFSQDNHLGNDRIFFAKAVEGRWHRVTDWIGLQPSPAPAAGQE